MGSIDHLDFPTPDVGISVDSHGWPWGEGVADNYYSAFEVVWETHSEILDQHDEDSLVTMFTLSHPMHASVSPVGVFCGMDSIYSISDYPGAVMGVLEAVNTLDVNRGGLIFCDGRSVVSVIPSGWCLESQVNSGEILSFPVTFSAERFGSALVLAAGAIGSTTADVPTVPDSVAWEVVAAEYATRIPAPRTPDLSDRMDFYASEWHDRYSAVLSMVDSASMPQGREMASSFELRDFVAEFLDVDEKFLTNIDVTFVTAALLAHLQMFCEPVWETGKTMLGDRWVDVVRREVAEGALSERGAAIILGDQQSS